MKLDRRLARIINTLVEEMVRYMESIAIRKKATRSVALTLAMLMLNPFTGTGVFAAAHEPATITAFDKLPGETAMQQLTVGAAESLIHLPEN